MDNFLEKLTLYDLVGYTVPGTLCVLELVWCAYKDTLYSVIASDLFKEYKIYILFAVLLLGYFAGIIITEIGSIIYRPIKHNKSVQRGIDCKAIGYDKIKNALVKAGVIDTGTDVCTDDDVKKYMGYMYGEIQVNPTYSRLHNYASMELVCQNMSVAVLIGIVVWIIRYGWTCEMIGGLVIIALLYSRWKFFYQRKNFYAVAWFVQAHND